MSDYLPTELLDEILVRVPVESLIRFTSVCKSWYSLITSPSFITKHLNHNKTNNENLFLTAYTFDDNKERYLLYRGKEKFIDEFSELESPLSTSLGHKRIVGSCNGLLCMIDGYLPLPLIIIWNPLIRKLVTLPMPSLPQTSPQTFVLGFGAHPSTYEYMLVYIVYERTDIWQRKFPSTVELYTQGTGSWRSVTAVGHPHHIALFNCLQAFVNGAIHWIALDSRGDSLIMLFNMGSLAFSVVMMPTALVNQRKLHGSHLSIMSYGESLAVLSRGTPGEGSCCIWVMKEYGVAESWAKLFDIILPGVLNYTILFRKNGEVMLSTMDHQLLSYDLETKTLTNIGFTGRSDVFTGDTFVGSLVFLKPGNGVF